MRRTYVSLSEIILINCNRSYPRHKVAGTFRLGLSRPIRSRQFSTDGGREGREGEEKKLVKKVDIVGSGRSPRWLPLFFLSPSRKKRKTIHLPRDPSLTRRRDRARRETIVSSVSSMSPRVSELVETPS